LIVLYGSECPEQLKEQALSLLGRFVSSRDANLRYLAVDAMTRLAKISTSSTDTSSAVEPFMPAILDALKDTDISLRKRALTLLFVMASVKSAHEIVAELVNHLPAAESVMKEDLVVKIAILAERFAGGDMNWYLDTLVQVLLVAGDYAAEAVWFRIAAIIAANPSVHDYAADKLFGLVQAGTRMIPELLVCLGGYILGEIGVNICEQPGKSGYDQFAALHQHFNRVSAKSQALLLTCYAKLANLYPEQVKDLAADLFTKHTTSSILDLQQRAVEYHTLINPAKVDPTVLETVLNTIPALTIDTRENILLTLEQQQQAGETAATIIANAKTETNRTADRSAWSVEKGERDASRLAAEKEKNQDYSTATVVSNNGSSQGYGSKQGSTVKEVVKVMDLLSMDDDSTPTPASAAPSASSTTAAAAAGDDESHLLLKAQLVRGAAHRALLFTTPTLLSVTWAGEVRGAQGRFALFCTALTSLPSNVKMELQQAPPAGLNVVFTAAETNPLNTNDEGRIMLAIEATRPFAYSDTVRLSLLIKSEIVKSVTLPVSLITFCTPLPMDKATYMTRWKAITAPGTEAQQVFNVEGKAVDERFMQGVKDTVFAMLGPAEGLDADNRTITGGLTFNTSAAVVGALLRLEADYATGRFRITVRSTNATVATAIKEYVVTHLTAK